MAILLHTADLHLGAPCVGLAPNRARLRQGELLESLQRAVHLANERNVELLLLAGDLFDDPQPAPDLARAAARALAGCRARVFLSPGNHDYYGPASPYAQDLWSPNVHIFRTRALQAVLLADLNTTVYGAAFLAPDRPDSPLKDFRCPQDGGTHLLVLHCDLQAGDSPYCPVSPQELQAAGFHYAALGHVHGRTEPGPGARWAYSGCPEGRGFDELGDKGVYLGEVTPEKCQLQFVPTAKRRYLEFFPRLRAEEDPGIVLDQILSPQRGEDLLRVTFRGEQAVPPDLTALSRQGEGRCFSLTLRDETAPPVDLWARTGEQTLRGQFLQELKNQLDRARGADRRETLELAARYGLAALDNTQPPGEEESPW